MELPRCPTPPTTFDPFFELLRSRGVSAGGVAKAVAAASDSGLLDLIDELRQALPVQYELNSPWSPYSFVANSRLSGMYGPTNVVAHRLTAADSLARFAVLYADTVYIQEPFSEGRFGREGRMPPNREAAVAEIEVMLALRPLLDAGIIRVARNYFPLQPGADGQAINDQMSRVTGLAAEALLERFAADVRFNVTYIPKTGFRMALADGPIELIENPSTVAGRGAIGRMGLGAPPELVAAIPKDATDLQTLKFGREHPAFESHFRELIQPIIADLGYATVCSTLYRLNYITDRVAETYALRESNASVDVAFNRSLFEAFSHDVPVVLGSPLRTLLKLRRTDWEAFRVYRDALRSALRTIKEDRLANPAGVFSDVIQPELNRIDLTMKRNRRLLLKTAVRDAAFATAAVGIGLLSGFVTPGLADAVAKLGGLKFAIDTVKNANAALLEPEEAKSSQYFFLWKVGRALRGTTRR